MTHGAIQVVIFGFVNHGATGRMAMLQYGMQQRANRLGRLVTQIQIIVDQQHNQVNLQQIRIVTTLVKKKLMASGNIGKTVNR